MLVLSGNCCRSLDSFVVHNSSKFQNLELAANYLHLILKSHEVHHIFGQEECDACANSLNSWICEP